MTTHTNGYGPTPGQYDLDGILRPVIAIPDLSGAALDDWDDALGELAAALRTAGQARTAYDEAMSTVELAREKCRLSRVATIAALKRQGRGC